MSQLFGLSRCGEVARGRRGITLIELMVAMSITTVVALMAYGFYRYWSGQMMRQKMVEALQSHAREATQSINRYLVSSGVGADSLFFDPHKLLNAAFYNGGHLVYEVSKDSAKLTSYGNFSGQVATVSLPMLFVGDRAVKVDKPEALRGVTYVYITAGSAQEVAKVASIDAAGKVRFTHDTWIPYPKGTLIFPLERIVIYAPDKRHLQIRRESADGRPGYVRDFQPSGYAGDSLSFRVTGINRLAGKLSYALRFSTRTQDRSHQVLVRNADQTVLVRGF